MSFGVVQSWITLAHSMERLLGFCSSVRGRAWVGAFSSLISEQLQWENRSVLLAVSLGYSFSYEPLAPFTAPTRAMGGAPIRKCVRIDVNTHDDVAVCRQSTLHFLGNLQPLRPGARHPIAVGENSQQRRIITFVDPVRANRRRRSLFF